MDVRDYRVKFIPGEADLIFVSHFTDASFLYLSINQFWIPCP